jgi:hypothetical protein
MQDGRSIRPRCPPIAYSCRSIGYYLCDYPSGMGPVCWGEPPSSSLWDAAGSDSPRRWSEWWHFTGLPIMTVASVAFLSFEKGGTDRHVYLPVIPPNWRFGRCGPSFSHWKNAPFPGLNVPKHLQWQQQLLVPSGSSHISELLRYSPSLVLQWWPSSWFLVQL